MKPHQTQAHKIKPFSEKAKMAFLLAFLISLASGAALSGGAGVQATTRPAVSPVPVLPPDFDAIVARAMKTQSLRGDFLDHAVDRYADIFIITGIFAGGLVPWQIGVFALTGVLMASYLGTQAQAVGVGRNYGGLLGRADRLVLILVFGVIGLFVPITLYGLTWLGWLLLMFGVFGHITAFQRFAYVWAKVE